MCVVCVVCVCVVCGVCVCVCGVVCGVVCVWCLCVCVVCVCVVCVVCVCVWCVCVCGLYVCVWCVFNIKVQCKEVKNTTSLLSVIMFLIERHVSAYSEAIIRFMEYISLLYLALVEPDDDLRVDRNMSFY